jgi:segregation and condensation protein A
MTTTPAQEAIAILIDLAEQGEIDPWDVRVIEVIDRFLSELGLLDSRDFSDQHESLSRSGQAFLWASKLVLLKADTLEQMEAEAEEEDSLPEIDEFEAENSARSLPLSLEQYIRRRSSAPPPRRRRVTLQELIEQIQQIATELEKVSTPNPLRRSARPQSLREATRIVTQLAHQENLTEMASELEEFLSLQLPQLAPDKQSIELEELLDGWHQRQACPDSPLKRDRVGVFWALLLLSSQSKVELSQTEFYQDLTIQVL